jgi:hypothetical protein
MNLVKVTGAIKNETLFINTAHIQGLADLNHVENEAERKGANCIIMFSNGDLCGVKETPEQVLAALHATVTLAQ